MSVRCFLDTNVFVYLLDRLAPNKAARAEQLIRDGLASGAAAISYQVVQEYCNVVTRRISPVLRPVDLEVQFAQVFGPMLAVESSLWLFRQALELQRQHHLAWYDALIVAAAQEAECRILYTEDLQNGQRFGSLRVENPFLDA